MQIVDIEKLMRDKLNECDEWLSGKDNALVALEEARVAFEKAQAQVAEYTDENIAQVVAYRDELKSRLGIVDKVEEVAEAHDEQVVEQVAVAEVASDEIVEHPLV
jgi:hypothetical protein